MKTLRIEATQDETILDNEELKGIIKSFNKNGWEFELKSSDYKWILHFKKESSEKHRIKNLEGKK